MNQSKWLKGLVLGLWIVGGSSNIYGMTSKVQAELTVVPVNYQNKFYGNGNYQVLDEEYKVYTQNGTVYLPLRLMSEMMSTAEANWEARWEASKPEEVLLVCNYMEKHQGGWNTTGEDQTIIKLTIGSPIITINGVEKEIGAAPEKIDGRIVLPLRALGQAIDKEVLYKEGLVFMGEDLDEVKENLNGEMLKQMKKRLEDPRKEYQYTEFPYDIQLQEGKMYYTQSIYNEETNDIITTLYEHEKEGRVTEVFSSNAYSGIERSIVLGQFYYFEKEGNEPGLYAINLKNKEKYRVCSRKELGEADFIQEIIPRGDELYVVVHYGDWTMGGESLYKIDGESVREVGANAHQFVSLVIEEDTIYYTEMDNLDRGNNLYAYDVKNKRTTALGKANYTYDIVRQIGSTSVSRSASGEMKIEGDKIYVLAYETESQTSSSAVIELDLNNGTQKQVTLPTQQYWFVEEQVYYVEKDTRYLIAVNKEGSNKHTVLEKPIGMCELIGNQFYYTLSNQDKEGQSGLYKFDLESGVIATISTKKVEDFHIGESVIYYTVGGIQPGIYKVKGGTTQCVEQYKPYEYRFVENGVVYKNPYTKEMKFK